MELTGAVSRPFMQKWDLLYLEKVRLAGILMRMYSRYVDDSKQIATVPLPGSRYDEVSGEVVVDEQNLIEEIPEDQRLVFILRTIANTDMDGIKIEAEYPSKNENKKMSILDMEAWMEARKVWKRLQEGNTDQSPEYLRQNEGGR